MRKAYLFSAVVTAATFTFLGCQKNSFTPQPPKVKISAVSPVQLPTDTTILSGTATLVGNATISGYVWAQVSGPAAAQIDDPGSASSTVRGLETGTYVFELMATDNKGATGTAYDTLQVLPPKIVTITLAPSNNSNEMELWGYVSGGDAGSNPNSPEVGAETWTVASQPVIGRSLFQFDFTTIPAKATILSATLTLVSDSTPSNGNLIDANFGANNAMEIQQVTSAWSTSSANWTNQPSTTTTNQVNIPSTSLNYLNLDSVDVTPMVQSMVSTSANYGFMIRLQSEAGGQVSRIFCSSRYSKAADHPSITIQYMVP